MAKNRQSNHKHLPQNPRVAIFYDWLNQWGGAEQVLLDILKIYPQADIFTLVYNPKKTKWLPAHHSIHTSFLNYLPFSKSNPIFYTPIYFLAAKLLNFKKYDLVISTTSNIGHYLHVPKQSLFVCYFHNINRYLYFTPPQFSWLTPLLNLYKKFDKKFISNIDLLLCNSQTVQFRIKNIYKKTAQIVYPAVDTDFFTPQNTLVKNYFLIVSRLVRHKKIDLAINACQKLKKKLIIIGTGRDKKYFKSISDSHYIKFLGKVSQTTLKKYYQNTQALICPQEEDFGITPLECNACGRPVIAYNHGGIPETITHKKHGLLFDDQTVNSLSDAINKFDQYRFDKILLHQNACRFSKTIFMLNFKKTIDQYAKHQK